MLRVEKEEVHMSTLLERTRKINRVLQRFHNVDYKEMATVLSSVIDANIYIVDTTGKIFGCAFLDDFECEVMLENVVRPGVFPKHYVQWLKKIDETSSNLRSKTGDCAFGEENSDCMFNGKNTTIVPIYGVGERIGTLIVAKYNDEFDDDDVLLAEYGAAVVGMEMLHDRARHNQEETMKMETVRMALGTLSISEAQATIAIFRKMKHKDGPVNASKIADMLTITRSVIVNALRKLESAGVVEPKSQGMKGTHIKVVNEYLWRGIEELANDTEMRIDDIFADYDKKLIHQYVVRCAKEHMVSGKEMYALEDRIWDAIVAQKMDVVDVTDIDFEKGFKMYAVENRMEVYEADPSDMLEWYMRRMSRK